MIFNLCFEYKFNLSFFYYVYIYMNLGKRDVELFKMFVVEEIEKVVEKVQFEDKEL